MHLDFKGHQVFSIMVQTMMSEYPLFPGVSAGGSSPSKRRVLRGRMGLQRRQQKDESHLQPFALGFLDIYPCSHPGSPGSYGRHGWWHPNSHSKSSAASRIKPKTLSQLLSTSNYTYLRVIILFSLSSYSLTTVRKFTGQHRGGRQRA